MLTLLPPMVWLISKFLFWSFKLTVKDHEHFQADLQAGRPVIGVAWHSRALILARFYHWLGYRPVVILVSQSFDGRLGGEFIKYNGFKPVFGSSARGGKEALEELIEWGKKGVNIVITPDGPRGPREEIKPGAVRLARELGVPIYPVTFYCDPVTRLHSWDRLIIPHPFARAICQVGKAVSVPADADDRVLEAKRQELENELRRITAEAESFFDSKEKSDQGR